jgi:hypothetical protein
VGRGGHASRVWTRGQGADVSSTQTFSCVIAVTNRNGSFAALCRFVFIQSCADSAVRDERLRHWGRVQETLRSRDAVLKRRRQALRIGCEDEVRVDRATRFRHAERASSFLPLPSSLNTHSALGPAAWPPIYFRPARRRSGAGAMRGVQDGILASF